MSDEHPLVVAVVPAFNGWTSSQRCLHALEGASYPNLRIVFVDDGSTDATTAELPRQFPRVRVVRGDGNLWWSGAMNAGIAVALEEGAEFVFAINNDVIADPTAIAALVACAKRHPEAVVGSLIFEMGNHARVWCAGGTVRWPWPGEAMIGGAANEPRFSGEWQVEWTPGMGTLVPRSVLRALGGFDATHFPQYLGDADFTLRARRAGYPVFVTSESRLYNQVENTGGLASQKKRISLTEAVSVFRSLKSPDHLSSRFAFIVRHCPKRWLIPALATRYARLLAYLIRRLGP